MIMRTSIESLKKSKTLRDISIFSLGQVLSQFFSLFVLFYVPKTLGAEHYGVYQVVINYIMMFKLLTFTGLNKVNIRKIAQTEWSEELNSKLSISLALRILVSVISVILSIGLTVLTPYSEPVLHGIYIFAIFLIFFAVEDHVNSVLVGLHRISLVTKLTLLKSFLLSLFAILTVYLGFSVIELILVYLIVQLILAISSVFVLRATRNYKFHFIWSFSLLEIKSALRFSIIDLFNLLSTRIDLFMLSLLTTPANVGVYAIASSMVRKGLIVRRAVSQVVFPKYAALKDKITFNQLATHSFLMGFGALIISLVIYFVFPIVIRQFLGDDYVSGITIIQVLCFSLVLQYMVVPLSASLETKGYEKDVIWIGFIRSVLNIVLNYVLFEFYGLIGIAYSTILTWVFNLLIGFIRANKRIQIRSDDYVSV